MEGEEVVMVTDKPEGYCCRYFIAAIIASVSRPTYSARNARA
jgi:hypothetical protein